MRDVRLLASLGAVCALLVFASLFLGSTTLSPLDVAGALAGQGDRGTQIIVWHIRLPRALAALVVGAALGLAGAALQGLLRNPLADPGVLGVSACASLAATLALYFGAAQLAFAAPFAATFGALAATALIAAAAARVTSVTTLILIGVGLSSFAGALMSLLLNFAPNPFTLMDMVNWMLGTVSNRSLVDIAFAAPFLAAGAAILFTAGRGLTALSLGEEAAHGLGLDLTRTRILVVAGAGLATGGAVGLAGAIGFVGLVAPHVVRPLVAHDPARTLAPAALAAGALLVGADLLVRVLPTTGELRLGVVAALIGAPAFIWIAARRRLGDG